MLAAAQRQQVKPAPASSQIQRQTQASTSPATASGPHTTLLQLQSAFDASPRVQALHSMSQALATRPAEPAMAPVAQRVTNFGNEKADSDKADSTIGTRAPAIVTSKVAQRQDPEDEMPSGGSTSPNQYFQDFINPRLASFYGSQPMFNQRDMPGYFKFGLNPLAPFMQILQNRDTLDPSLAHLRGVGRTTRNLSKFTDPSPTSVLDEEQIGNSQANMSALMTGMGGRIGAQSYLIRRFMPKRFQLPFMLGNVAFQAGSNLLAKDSQLRQSIEEQGLDLEQLDLANRVMSDPSVEDYLGKPKD